MPSAATVIRLYQTPVKGLTPALVDHLSVSATGAVDGDRVLGFLFADAGDSQREGWWRKNSFLSMQNTPELALVDCRFDAASKRMSLSYGGREVASGSVEIEADREQLARSLQVLVAGFEVNPLADQPAHAPLSLVGDGVTPRFHDRTAQHVTLLGSASIEALADRIGTEVDERRFRMNVTIDGLEPWVELGWIGKAIRIGETDYDVTGPVVRCLATHANPLTGVRDQNVMQTLTRDFGHERPTMGVLAVPRVASSLRVGDEVIEV